MYRYFGGTQQIMALIQLIVYGKIIWAAPCDNVSSGICGQRSRSACATAQSDQSLHCLLTESFDTTECISEQ